MIILQILLRYLKNKSLLITTIIFYFFSLISITVFVLYDKEIVYMDMNEINEKNVDFFNVFFPNMLLITKIFVFGFISVGIYALFSLLQNIISIGLICNSLIYNGNERLILKMIPHGMFEFLGMSLAASLVLWVWVIILKRFPRVAKREINAIDICKKIVPVIVITYVINIIIFIFAGIIEVIVSSYKVLG